MDALHTAAATLPRAMAVKAIDDCTVEGSRVRNSMPIATGGARKGRAATPSPQHREQDVGRGEHREVQPPVAHPRQHRLAGQLGAVEEEQQDDRDVRDGAEQRHPGPARRQQRGEDDRADQHQDERLEDDEEALQHPTRFARSVAGCNGVAPFVMPEQSGEGQGCPACIVASRSALSWAHGRHSLLTDTAIVETARALLDLDIPPECLPGVRTNLAVLAGHAKLVEQPR